ncbi:hypothetical protein O181_072283 [Austropuccinia psidii MF-1]|uniref:Uncharacterized protein n=1 Tax=Austropuccinia psidii MF-1 TaxID=1389203 RepID=A0A9Q3I908_9BASI|nr:hypothetical protein [Austropuccinia psidii MF-1]
MVLLKDSSRYLLGKSNIPSSYWHEAVSHASLLLNLLPHNCLNIKSHTRILHDQNFLVEPENDLNRLGPLAIKFTAKVINPSSNIEPRGEIFQEFTFEKYSDGLQLLNLEIGKIRVSHDFIPTVFNPTLSINQLQKVLPTLSSLTVRLQIPTLKVKQSVIEQKENPKVTHSRGNVPSIDSTQIISSTQQSKHYDYVPYYKEAPKNTSIPIIQDNVVSGRRNTCDSNHLMLSDLVHYTQAISYPMEQTKWKKAMDTAFNSLIAHSTCELVLYPENPDKVIGGMWRLT